MSPVRRDPVGRAHDHRRGGRRRCRSSSRRRRRRATATMPPTSHERADHARRRRPRRRTRRGASRLAAHRPARRRAAAARRRPEIGDVGHRRRCGASAATRGRLGAGRRIPRGGRVSRRNPASNRTAARIGRIRARDVRRDRRAASVDAFGHNVPPAERFRVTPDGTAADDLCQATGNRPRLRPLNRATAPLDTPSTGVHMDDLTPPPITTSRNGCSRRAAARWRRASSSRPTVSGSTRPASICAQCSVQPECLEYALTYRIDHGVWGGASERERRRILRRRRVDGARSPSAPTALSVANRRRISRAARPRRATPVRRVWDGQFQPNGPSTKSTTVSTVLRLGGRQRVDHVVDHVARRVGHARVHDAVALPHQHVAARARGSCACACRRRSTRRCRRSAARPSRARPAARTPTR